MIDVTDPDTASTLERVNPALNNARARDIATVDGSGIAQKISTDLGDPTASDAAKLIFVSSLPVGPNALQGLTPEEIAAHPDSTRTRCVGGKHGADDLPRGG